MPLTACKHPLSFSVPLLKLCTGQLKHLHHPTGVDEMGMKNAVCIADVFGTSVGHGMSFACQVSSSLHGPSFQGKQVTPAAWPLSERGSAAAWAGGRCAGSSPCSAPSFPLHPHWHIANAAELCFFHL